ncbi:ABC transporter permease [Paenibacillus piri]|uniref:ABC transporter permease n=2 Tax=Paenibacillus piri TaxID=2547395 RepID=A0A4R5KI25_9BACL|nr:ABC transporter permease [Paenibacillus piri]TDF93880.1 ABC transporter permease [Paenibacillus piri]
MRTVRSSLSLLFYLLAIGLLAMGFIYLNTNGVRGGAMGFRPQESRDLFYFLAVAQLVLIAFMTPGLTAGVISGEREKQTLNILLTTQQSSTTIILSKLVSSLSFMLLVIIATLPVYSIVFLFGGISPKQLSLVFLFYIFSMFVLGAFGVLFSTVFKRTMIAVVVTYGFTLAVFGGTGLLFLFLRGVFRQFYQGGTPNPYSWIGYVLGLNPVAALLSIFEPSLNREAFGSNMTPSGTPSTPPIELWQEFVAVYAVLAVGALLLSIRYIRPRLKRRR